MVVGKEIAEERKKSKELAEEENDKWKEDMDLKVGKRQLKGKVLGEVK